ncbi:Intracisternal A-particle Pol-related polyprotein [Amphibalanus amphitrite]|uniref:RNA-directed DNA polymerase n=2 Tax=Amphibalanus amphitrite TaxID=1232801 RepID=A0A6A4VFN1_AMPAM|nr:Intracisternal A-particle Pol-related polyprotein [Amphibalanus amphitrite]
MTRRSVFSWCGRIVAHLPVCGWLRPATAWLKRRVNSLTRGWDDVTHDAALREQLKHVAERLASEDPARGQWCVTGHRAVLWTDASSIAAGVVLESEGGDVIEDACWLRRDEATHINMAELDAAVRGINLALAWDMKTIELKTDSATVHRWVSDALSGRARLRTKAHGEMLIRRRVDVIRQLVAELGISLTVSLVRSSQNRSDTLTRVPSLWLRQDSQPADQRPSDGQPVAAAAVVGSEVGDGGGAVTVDFRQAVTDVHVRAGHPGVRRTLYFARRDVSSSISRKVVREVVTACDVCRAVDPAPVTWRHGSLAVEGTWDRLAIDVTHYGGQSYLSVIDCGPSRFCVWRLLRRSDAATVTSELEQVFAERGAPAELLADNDTAFRSRQFAAFAARWGVLLRFRAVHRPSGNSIVERNHRSVKVIAARKKCGIGEAVHLYNITPRDGGTAAEAPANGIYRYPVRDAVRQRATAGASEEAVIGRPPARREGDFQVGDAVWVRRPGTRCTERSVRGTVSGVVSPQVVEVGGVPWHIRDLRHCGDTGGPAAGPRTPDRGSGGPQEAEEDRAGSPIVMTFGYEGDGAPGRPVEEADDAGGECGRSESDSGERVVRRGQRNRRPPDFFGHVVPIDALNSSSGSDDLEDQGEV